MDKLEELKKEVLNCKKCLLYKTRKNIVFGEGNPNAKIMFIGEGPGQTEDETGHAFVGKSGKLLDDLFKESGIKREDIYIANIVKCRVPYNADPSNESRKICFPYLYKQIELIKPKVIVCLGRVAATTLIDSNFKITKQRGKWFKRGDYYMTSTYHPSALLRNQDLINDARKDFKFLGEKYKELNKNT